MYNKFGGYNMAFENGFVLEDWRCVVIVPLYKRREDNAAIIGVLV